MTLVVPVTPASIFPLLVPVDLDATCYEGFLSLPDAGALETALWLRISRIITSDARPLQGARLECGPGLAKLLQGREALVRTRMGDSASLAAFLAELRSLLQGALRRAPPPALPPAAFYAGLQNELEQVGWRRLAWLAEDLSSLRLLLQDHAGREHVVRVELPASYPADPPSTSAQLPAAVELAWPPGSTLASVVRQYEAALHRFQALWDALDDLDRHAWVLEPEQAARDCVFRRVALGRHCSILVFLKALCLNLSMTFFIDHPLCLPECRFLGSEAAVAPLKDCLHRNRLLWDEQRLPTENLRRVLERDLPCKESTTAVDDVSIDCCICYGYRLPSILNPEGDIPDVNCSNPQCGRPFHRSCIITWLKALTDTRQSFNTLFGQCPYCTGPITVAAK